MRKYRNTSIDNNLPAPAVLLQGRYINGGLPRHTRSHIPTTYDYNKVQAKMAELKSLQKMYYDRKAGKVISILRPGDRVRTLIKDKWVSGSIVAKCSEPRSYIVRTALGDYRRTRNHIRLSQSPENVLPVTGGGSGPSCVSSRPVQLAVNPPSCNLHTSIPVSSGSSASVTPSSSMSQPYRTRAGRTVVAPARLSYSKF